MNSGEPARDGSVDVSLGVGADVGDGTVSRRLARGDGIIADEDRAAVAGELGIPDTTVERILHQRALADDRAIGQVHEQRRHQQSDEDAHLANGSIHRAINSVRWSSSSVGVAVAA